MVDAVHVRNMIAVRNLHVVSIKCIRLTLMHASETQIRRFGWPITMLSVLCSEDLIVSQNYY